MKHPDTSFQALYEAHYKKLIVAAYHMVGSIHSAQDLVQETFMLALLKWDTLSCHALPEGWLMLTLKNRALNKNHFSKRHPEVPLDSVILPAKEPAAKLEEMLPRQLSEEDREILIWRFERQMEYREMADRLGISETGCRSRVSRAVARCKKFLEDP